MCEKLNDFGMWMIVILNTFVFVFYLYTLIYKLISDKKRNKAIDQYLKKNGYHERI